MSSADRVDISYQEEAQFGVTPQAGNFKKIPFTAAPDFAFTPSTVQSQEIRSDRQVDDLPLVGAEAGGSLDIEFSFKRFDDLLAGAFFNNFSSNEEVAGGAVAALNQNQIQFASPGDIPDTLKQGALILLEDAGDASGVYLVGAIASANVAIVNMKAGVKGTNFKLTILGFQLDAADVTEDTDANTLTLDDAQSKAIFNARSVQVGDWLLVQNRGFYRVRSYADAQSTAVRITYDQKIEKTDGYSQAIAAGKNNVYFCNSIKNGVTKKSFSLLQRFGSIQGDNQALFNGCVVNTLELSLETQAIITGSINFSGLNAKYLTALIPSNRIVDAESELLLNSSSNVGDILVGGSKVSGPNYVQSASVSINNNARRQNAVGSIGAVGIEPGQCQVTGALSTYFGTVALARSVIDNDESSFVSVLSEDGKNRGVLIDIPRIKFSSGAPGVTGVNTDIVLPLEYQALRHQQLGYEIKLCTFPVI